MVTRSIRQPKDSVGRGGSGLRTCEKELYLQVGLSSRVRRRDPPSAPEIPGRVADGPSRCPRDNRSPAASEGRYRGSDLAG